MEHLWSAVHTWGGWGWSLLWEAAHSESLPAAARSKHFLPFFLSLPIYKTEIVIQLPFGKYFDVYGQSTLVFIGADVCQPSCPLEIITLHSLGSRGGQVHGLLLLLIGAVCQPLLQEHRRSEISQLLESFLSPQCSLPCNTVASIEFPVQDIIDELQQVQSRLVWAGAKGQRHLGWLGWTRDGFMQKSTKVTSNTCREVFKKIIPGSSQCCLVWQETAGWKGRGSRVRLQPGYDRDFFPMKTSKQVVRTVHLPSIRREFHDWTR